MAVACLALDLAPAVCCRCLAVTAWHRLAVLWWCPVVWAARHRRLARWLYSRLAAHLRAVVMCRCPVAWQLAPLALCLCHLATHLWLVMCLCLLAPALVALVVACRCRRVMVRRLVAQCVCRPVRVWRLAAVWSCRVARVVLVWVVTSPSRLALGHRRAAQCASRRVVVMPVVWCRCHLARRRVRHLGQWMCRVAHQVDLLPDPLPYPLADPSTREVAQVLCCLLAPFKRQTRFTLLMLATCLCLVAWLIVAVVLVAPWLCRLVLALAACLVAL